VKVDISQSAGILPKIEIAQTAGRVQCTNNLTTSAYMSSSGAFPFLSSENAYF